MDVSSSSTDVSSVLLPQVVQPLEQQQQVEYIDVMTTEDIVIGTIIAVTLSLFVSFLQSRRNQNDIVLWYLGEDLDKNDTINKNNEEGDNKKNKIVFGEESWKEMSRPENYVLYNTKIRNRKQERLNKKKKKKEKKQKQEERVITTVVNNDIDKFITEIKKENDGFRGDNGYDDNEALEQQQQQQNEGRGIIIENSYDSSKDGSNNDNENNRIVRSNSNSDTDATTNDSNTVLTTKNRSPRSNNNKKETRSVALEPKTEKKYVLVLLLLLFVPIFSFEFFLTFSRQAICGDPTFNYFFETPQWAEQLCAPAL